MIYDLIIIGAGAAGLFAGASLPYPVKGLMIEKSSSPGRKLLMSGAGQCNLTQGGSMKDFISHYGKNGNQIRSILYRFNNKSLINFFHRCDVPLFQREDGKVFPQSLKAENVLDALVKLCINNGFKFIYSSPVTNITWEKSSLTNESKEEHIVIYTIHCGKQQYKTNKLIISTGGCSYPSTGSDGSFYSILEAMGIKINTTKPALVPIYVQNYPFKDLSGISFSSAAISIYNKLSNENNLDKLKNQGNRIAENTDALLLTHTCFSGPAILNISRHATIGDLISINYYPEKSGEIIFKQLSEIIIGNKKQIITVLYEYFNTDFTKSPVEMPKRFLDIICSRCNVISTIKSSQLTTPGLKSIINMITNDIYSISDLGGYNVAMVTSGGVSLNEVNSKTLESIRYSNLYFAGEVLDVDGDTGGYNLQFAYSSGKLAAENKE